MRNRKQSRFSTLIAACVFLFVGQLLCPFPSQASNFVAITQQDGRIVYVNADPPSEPSHAWEFTDARPPSHTEIDSIVRRVANRYQIDPKLVRAVIQAESGYDPRAVSAKGAMGLMQLIPSTAQRFGVANPFNPKQNIEGGVSYLSYLLKLFGGNLPLSLAAYNAGENTVIRSGGIPAIPETEHYVREVTHLYHPPTSGSVRQADSPTSGVAPIYRYVDSSGVVHFTNVQ
ncbi:MAG: lytic transglycosylase domain-containing protein [Acidobacteria bacterium]|nr:lytic transglycosylase domain-containing protein [Acidobacteriota bacterium]